MSATLSFTTAERQLLSTLAWFRSRYALFMGLALDRKADREGIEEFGQNWIGEFKEDWTDAFESLCARGILTLEEGAYSFTDLGNAVVGEVDKEIPFYKYEYDSYFQQDSRSKAHSRFCEKVYGLDLSQHGLIDQAELGVLTARLRETKPASLVDLGCGNGRITEWVCGETGISSLGLDISSEAIHLAKQRTAGNPLLRFEVGNLNSLHLQEKFDAVVFMDTLYYATSLQETIRQAADLLTDGGRIHAYFSQWIMDEAYAENLLPANTHLAKAARELGLKFSFVDLSTSGIAHWKRKLRVLEEMRQDFEEEGSMALWEYRHREAYRYANWGDHKYSRHLYEIWM